MLYDRGELASGWESARPNWGENGGGGGIKQHKITSLFFLDIYLLLKSEEAPSLPNIMLLIKTYKCGFCDLLDPIEPYKRIKPIVCRLLRSGVILGFNSTCITAE